MLRVDVLADRRRVWRPMLLLCGMLAVVVGLLVGTDTALAHADLLSSSPNNQELLEVSPTEIALQFSESVDPITPGIRVVDAEGNDVKIGNVDQSTGADRMRAEVSETLAPGSYVVAWQAVSADSHRIRGAFTFSVGTPSTVVPGVVDGIFDASGDGGSDVLLGIGRFLSYAGIAVLVGGIVMATALTPSLLATRRVGLVLAAAAVVACLGTLWLVAAQARVIGGGFLSWGTVADTQSGSWWFARIVVVVLFSVLLPIRGRLAVRGGVVVPAALGIGVLGVVAAGGHAVSGDDVVLGFIATVLHLAAMSVWVGGLALVLAVRLRGDRLREEVDGASRPNAPANDHRSAGMFELAARFSPWALGSVVALALTGSVSAWRQLGSLDALTNSSYGRWLVVKLILVALVVVAAWFSRRAVRHHDQAAGGQTDRGEQTNPGDQTDTANQTAVDDRTAVESRRDHRIAGLRRAMSVELVGMMVVLMATAGLVNSPPPQNVAEIGSASAVVGSRVAQVELEPAVTGGTELHIYLTSPSGTLDRADEITVRAALPAQGIPLFNIPTFPAGPNHVIATNVNLPVAGLWTFEVAARYGDFDEVVFTVEIAVSD